MRVILDTCIVSDLMRPFGSPNVVDLGEGQGLLRKRGARPRPSVNGGHINRNCVNSACVRCLAERRETRKAFGTLCEVQEEEAAYWAKWDVRGGR